MTREQLDLLIQYINLKSHLAALAAQNKQAPHAHTDKLVDLIEQLEASTEEAP